jgi:hypothetical protein
MNKVSNNSDIKDSRNMVTIEVYDSVEVVDINKGKSARELKMRKIITDITSVIIKAPEKNKQLFIKNISTKRENWNNC